MIVTTIHQAKGLEWPVVVVGSLDFDNRDVDPVGWSLRSYCRRPLFEPARRIAEFDHMRQHYVAFSRPRDLLALTASGPVHPRFSAIWDGLPRWNEMDPRALGRQRFPPEEAADGSQAPVETGVIPFLKRLDVWIERGVSSAGTGEVWERTGDNRS